jgi:hypothetical protein
VADLAGDDEEIGLESIETETSETEREVLGWRGCGCVSEYDGPCDREMGTDSLAVGIPVRECSLEGVSEEAPIREARYGILTAATNGSH